MKNIKRNSLYALPVLAVAALLAVSLLNRPMVKVTGATHILMGTTVRVTAVAADENTARKAIKAADISLSKVEERLSYYKIDSELSSLNSTPYGQDVHVSDELFYLVKQAIEFNKLTDGAFDCTIAPVLDLWKQAAKNGSKPTPRQLQEAKSKTGSDKLILDERNRTIRFAVEGMRIDLGGIAKGYAIDKAITAMRQNGAAGGLVDAGGDIRCFGTAPGGKNGWKIGLQNPHTEEQQSVILQFVITDLAITTSGDYYRFVVVDNEKISHIIDPATTKGARELQSVSVIASDATTADALSTAVTVLGREKGKALIESLPGTEALLITAQGDIIKTSGIDKYRSKP